MTDNHYRYYNNDLMTINIIGGNTVSRRNNGTNNKKLIVCAAPANLTNYTVLCEWPNFNLSKCIQTHSWLIATRAPAVRLVCF